MDGAPQDSTILVIVPNEGGGYVAVKIHKVGVESCKALANGVNQGHHVFPTALSRLSLISVHANTSIRIMAYAKCCCTHWNGTS